MEAQQDTRSPKGALPVGGATSMQLPPGGIESQGQRQYRISTDSALEQSVSTMSPFYSPVSPTFPPQNGLAPRPPSFPYKARRPRSGVSSIRSSRPFEGENQRRPPSWQDVTANSAAPEPSPGRSKSFSARAKAFSVKFDDEVSRAGVLSPPSGLHDAVTPPGGSLNHSNEMQAPSALPVAQEEPVLPRDDKSAPLPGSGLESPPDKAPVAAAQSRAYSRSVSASTVPSPQAKFAPDRSPLQKLELTLKDITKEERRAQLEEAELLAREARVGRISLRISRGSGNGPPTQSTALVSSKADPLAEAGLVRSLSSKQKDRIQRSATIESRSPQHSAQPLDYVAGGGGFEYQEQEYREEIPAGLPIQRKQTEGTRTQNPVSQPAPRSTPEYEMRSITDSRRSAKSGQSTRSLRSPELNDGRPNAVSPKQQAPGGDRKIGSRYEGDVEESERSTSTITTRNLRTGSGVREGSDVLQQRSDGYARRRSLSLDSSQPITGQNHIVRDYSAETNRAGNIPSSEKSSTPSQRTGKMQTLGTVRLTRADMSVKIESGEQEPRPRNTTWWETGGTAKSSRSSASRRRDRPSDDIWQNADHPEINGAVPTSFSPALYLKCGPLLRYLGMRQESSSSAHSEGNTPASGSRHIWRGSIMIVTTDSDSIYEPAPTLRLFLQPPSLRSSSTVRFDIPDIPDTHTQTTYVDPIAGLPKVTRTGGTVYVKPIGDLQEERDLSRIENEEGLFEETRNSTEQNLHSNNGAGSLGDLPTSGHNVGDLDGEKLGKFREVKAVRLFAENGITFWRFIIEVELGQQQARIAYRINRGPAMTFWVPAKGESMNIMFHSCNGFSLNVNPDQFNGPDPLWRDVLNAHQIRPFHVMVGGGDQIYNDAVTKQTRLFQSWLAMRNPTHKHSAEFSVEMENELEDFYLERYSMWFSQGLFGMAASQIPMINIWDDHDIIDGFGSYPHQFMSSPVFSGLGAVAFKYYMLFQHHSLSTETSIDEPSWLLGASPGPYIKELSRSVFMFLGMKVAFLGLDCRTERMRDEILSEETYNLVFDRCRREIIKGATKHLIVLLGVPIAYPRLVWLENAFTSRLLDPVKALGRSGILGGLTNKLDGGVEILDDLDDHWTARKHKAERNWFIQALQDLAAEKSVRVTILSGDVHLGAVGQFYSNPLLGIAKDRDHRYMPNVISSAIVNTPPPEMLSDALNKRNRVHHLDQNTDEDMIPMFRHDVDGKPRNNKRLLPRRNWCSIREYKPGRTPPPTPPSPEPVTPEQLQRPTGVIRSLSLSRKDIHPAKLFRRISRRESYAERSDSANNAGGEAGTILRPSDSADGYFPRQDTPPARTDSGNSINDAKDRPNPFQRQTTDFLDKQKKAGSKGPAGQGGSTIDLSDGLDVVLNVEVNRRDPAGVTLPYRLLVPALWYDEDQELQEQQQQQQQQQQRRGLEADVVEPQKKGWLNWTRRASLFRRQTDDAENDPIEEEPEEDEDDLPEEYDDDEDDGDYDDDGYDDDEKYYHRRRDSPPPATTTTAAAAAAGRPPPPSQSQGAKMSTYPTSSSLSPPPSSTASPARAPPPPPPPPPPPSHPPRDTRTLNIPPPPLPFSSNRHPPPSHPHPPPQPSSSSSSSNVPVPVPVPGPPPSRRRNMNPNPGFF